MVYKTDSSDIVIGKKLRVRRENQHARHHNYLTISHADSRNLNQVEALRGEYLTSVIVEY